MSDIKRRTISAAASAALLFNLATPVFAGSTVIEISGNGSSSTNDAEVTTTQNTSVVQFNDANVNNDVKVNAATGGNIADDNTGGDVEIDTGDAETDVNVHNSLNSNVAEVENCACEGDTEVLISGNGSESTNDVNLHQNSSVGVFQDNAANVQNKVDVDADTGDNRAEDNTGGSVEITTGDAETEVNVSTAANANSARVGGGSGGDRLLSARIVGNGSGSDNDINLGFSHDLLLSQLNSAYIGNYVDVDADTGDNRAEDNTGGSVEIETGDAEADVTVDNFVNFNSAETDCGCFFDVLAKISGNGADSDNDIKAKISDRLDLFQHNEANLHNKVDVDADTGDNKVEDSTGDVEGDPSIETGDAETTVEVTNDGNSNVIGDDGSGLDFPLGSGINLNISLDLSDLLDFLGL